MDSIPKTVIIRNKNSYLPLLNRAQINPSLNKIKCMECTELKPYFPSLFYNQSTYVHEDLHSLLCTSHSTG